tara:strand:+ start:1029 stop:1508 length:480 start_codon:yes stop_codon:yes gene_type:complete
MANLQQFFEDEFVPESIDTSNDFDAIPAGDYSLIVKGTEVKKTKAGTGQILSVEYEVLDGECIGRKLFGNFNLVNPNRQAVDIGRKQLAQLSQAVGIRGPLRDSAQLHDVPFRAVVICKKSEQYGMQNEIRKYLPMSAATHAEPVSAATSGNNAPWQKG